jgi:hypothetical protein
MISWLASYPKSGNTWARLLLSAYHHDGPANINDAIGTGDANRVMYQSACVRPITMLSRSEQVLLRPAALLNMLYMNQHRPLVTKTHFANCELFGVRMVPPAMTQGAVYLVRDPRDVAVSLSKHYGKTIDEAIDMMADEQRHIGGDDEITHMLSTWSNHVKSWGSGEPEVTLVKYEDMIADTADALERMLLTFGINPDAARIERAVAACELDRLKSQEDARGFKEASKKADRFFGDGEGWREVLSDEQLRRVQKDHGKMMVEIGYKREFRSSIPTGVIGVEATG